MRLEMIRQEQREKANFLYDLCDVSAISLCDSRYYDDVKGYFRDSMMTPEERARAGRMGRHVFDADDPVDSLRAAHALNAMLGGGVIING